MRGSARARVRAAFAVSAVLLSPHARPAGAQTTTASIQGTVADETGAVPGATVTARERQSGFQFEAVTERRRRASTSPGCARAPTRSR